MKSLFAMASKAGALVLCVALAACSSMAHSYMSPDERQANGRQLLHEAVQQSDVVSIRAAGGATVLRIVRVGTEEYCTVLLATWESERHFEGWRSYDGDNLENIRCGSYHGIESVKPKDMRNCQGSECLWLRGL